MSPVHIGLASDLYLDKLSTLKADLSTMAENMFADEDGF